jgi:hypothetical protein
MDDGASDRDSLPEIKQATEADLVGHDIASLTRRSFLVGAGSVAGAYATGAFAATKATYRWSIYRAPDPRADGRSVVAVCFDDRDPDEADLRWCFLPEVSFSENAKATIQPLPSKIHGTDAYDLQAVFSGLEIARPHISPPKHFSLIFRFIHLEDKTDPRRTEPRFAIVARDLLSPGERPLTPLLTLKQWRSAAPIEIDAQLAPGLLNAVFSTRLRLPRSGKINLALVRPTDQDRRLIWRFRAAGPTTAHANAFAVVADQAAKLGDSEFGRAVVGSSATVDMWRAHSALEKDADNQPQGVAAANTVNPPAADNSRPAPDKTPPKPTPPRTLAQLTAFRPNGTSVVLGENSLSDGQVSSLVLRRLEVDNKRPVQLVRRDRSGYPRGIKTPDDKIGIETTLPVAGGELSVHTTRVKKTARREGPFSLGLGTMTFSGAPDQSLALDADFQLSCHNISLLTAFGPFEVERPEDKRIRRRNASEPGQEHDETGSSQYETRQPVRLSVTDRVIKAFEATARVNSVGVALSKSNPDDHHAYRVDLGFPQGCEVLFRLFGLNDSANTRHGIGRVSLGTSPGAQPAKGTYAGPYVLPLDNADLQLRRWRDLVCLKYRFAGLDLVQEGGGKAYLAPRGLARQTSFDTSPRDASGKLTDPDMSTAPFDPRALMVVEFPSQHVAEEAFFEQRIERPAPPRYPASLLQDKSELAKKFDKLRTLYLSQNPRMKPLPDSAKLDAKAKKRIALRGDLLKAVQDAIKAAQDNNTPLPADVGAFDQFRAKFETVYQGLPLEQKKYVGDEFLDPEARRVAEIAANALIIAKADFSDSLPDDPVSPEERTAASTHQEELYPSKDNPKQKQQNDNQVAKIIANLQQTRDPFFVALQKRYKADVYTPLSNMPGADSRLADFNGRTQLRQVVEDIRKSIGGGAPNAAALTDFLNNFVERVNNLVGKVQNDMGLSGDEEPPPTSRARLSGPSRLAFRINTDDFETGDQGGRIEFTVSELTNWSRHELVVIRRAQRLLKAYADGSRRPRWDMQEDYDLASRLVHMGFSRGGWADRGKSKDGNGSPRNWSQATVTAEQRLAEVAASAAAAPGPFETAIEMPFRLFLSPSQDGRFRTRREVPTWLLSLSKDTKPKGIVEPLWRAAFEVEPNSALRAIWSPDFRPEAFVPGTVGQGQGGFVFPCPSRTNRPPMRGPYAPWAMGRDTSDNHVPPDIVEAPRFRTSLDAFDRHELVTLSSLHGLPVIGKVGLDPQNNVVRLGKDQAEPPEGFQIATPNWEGVDEEKRKLLPSLNDVYLPKVLDTKGLELALSSLGGYLRVNTSFDPPASILTGKGEDYYSALSIERWRHNIVLGRDISAEVVYKGYLFPIGLHCTLIKITERRFQKVAERHGPVAVLRQRMFLRIGNPTKNFPAYQQPDEGRRLPFRTLTVVTTQTPDIVDPYDVTSETDGYGIYSSGRIDLGKRPRGTAFWPRTSKRLGGEVKFDLLVDGNIPTRLPLIFVDNAAANDQNAVQKVCEHYNSLGLSSDPKKFLPALVQAGFAGAKLAYAPESKAGDTQFETQSLVFGAEGRAPDGFKPKVREYQPFQSENATNSKFSSDPFMQGADQPPFYPAMRFATVKIGQIERLVGHPLDPARVAFDPSYAVYGFPEPKDQTNAPILVTNPPGTKKDDPDAANPKEIFLSLIDKPKLAFGQGGDKGGGVSRPEMTVYALSRQAGPISANPTSSGQASTSSASSQDPDKPAAITAQLNDIKSKSDLAKSFFPENATLLGLIKLSDLIETIITLAGGRVPVLKELVDYGGGLAGDADAFIRQRVLEPLQQTLRSLDQPMNKSIDLGGETKRVADIYPDVVRAYNALNQSVQAAIDAPPPAADDPGATISTYTAVYTSGRGFVNAVERALRDPITPLREAARNWLNDQFAELKSQFDKTITTTITDFDPKTLRADLRLYITNKILLPLRSAIFVLPPPASYTPANGQSIPWDTLTGLLYDSIEQALNQDSVWPGIKDESKAFFDINAFKSELHDVFVQKATQIDAGLRTAQADALATINATDLLVADARILIDQDLDNYTKGLASLKTTDLGNLQTLFKLAQPVTTALLRLESLSEIRSKFADKCDSAVGALKDLILASLPTGGGSPDPSAFARVPTALSSLSTKAGEIAQLISQDAAIPKDTKDTLDDVRGMIVTVTQDVSDLCTVIFKNLTALQNLIADFNGFISQGSFAADICTSANPWQLQRLLNYARRASTLAAVSIGNAQSIISKIGAVLLDKKASALFRPLAASYAPSALQTTSPDSPNTWIWPTGDLERVPDAFYRVDLVRQRFFYLILPTLRAAASATQAFSLAGIPFSGGGAAAKLRRDAFGRLNSTINGIVIDHDKYGALLNCLDGIYSNTKEDGTLAKQVNTVVASLNSATDAAIQSLQNTSGVIGDDFASAARTLVDTNGPLKGLNEAAQKVIVTVVGSAALGADAFKGPIIPANQPIQALLGLLLDYIAGRFQGDIAAVTASIMQFVTNNPDISGQLQKLYKLAADSRDDLYKQVVAKSASLGPAATQVANALLAPGDRKLTIGNDALRGQSDAITTIDGTLRSGSDKLGALVQLFDLVGSWQASEYEIVPPPKAPVRGPNAILFISEQAKNVVAGLLRDAVKGDLGKIIDFAAIKSDVERRLRDLIPSKVTLAYDFDTELQPVAGIFLPQDGSRLTLKARTVIDVLNGGSPQVTASGELGPFSVNILGGFLDIVTLSFDGAKFGSETGGKLKANVVDVQLGEAVSFLQAVSSFFSFGANGFYLSVLFDPPGIEAGYRMPPCGFALGVLGISNISLNAAAILPFDGSPALFKVGLSRPESPFLINVAVYGGGGHLALYSSAQGIIGFESSFEFGAVVAFAIGPLTGNARITVGIFLRSFKSGDKTLSTIEGYTTVAGSASISIFRFSAMLQVRVGQQPNGEMVGTAIFTFSFSMGIKDIEFRVTARKSMGKGYSSNPNIGDAGDIIDPSRKLIQLAANLPSHPVASDVGGGPHSLPAWPGKTQCDGEDGKKECEISVAYLHYHAVCKGEDYKQYQSYFDQHQPWQPSFFS